MKSLNCFVIIGFGKKTSYASGKPRILDLDETFSLLIKPIFKELNINCYRAIDKNISGSIDKLMLQEIKNADIALVDISTLNANVMWELGVRHALKPHHTIMICEKEQMGSIPFDVNSFVIHQYTHSEEGIPYKEVERFRSHLKKIVEGALNQNPKIYDSPVFTFLENELNSEQKIKITAHEPTESFSDLLKNAETLKSQKEFSASLNLFQKAKAIAEENMSLRDSLTFIISREALCTYKSKAPNELEALEKARNILGSLQPQQNTDVEILGLTGAINKRLFELTSDLNYLNKAISVYEKGFQLKQDYYNGINAAFMLYKKADLLKSQHKEWEDEKLNADYLRNAVLKIALDIEKEAGFKESDEAIWVLLTIAEAYHYKGKNDLMASYENKAKEIATARKDAFAMSSYNEQKDKIKGLDIEF